MSMVVFKLENVHNQASAILKEMCAVKTKLDQAIQAKDEALIETLTRQFASMEGRYSRITKKMTAIGRNYFEKDLGVVAEAAKDVGKSVRPIFSSRAAISFVIGVAAVAGSLGYAAGHFHH